MTYSAASQSQPGTRHSVSLDLQTGETLCTCRAAEYGRRCWHLDWLETAWLMTRVAPFVATLDDAGLLATGTAARARLDGGTATVTDIVTYYQCRVEWRERAARAGLARVLAFERTEKSAIVAVAA